MEKIYEVVKEKILVEKKEENVIKVKDIKIFYSSLEESFFDLAHKKYKMVLSPFKKRITFCEWEKYIDKLIKNNSELDIAEMKKIISYNIYMIKHRESNYFSYLNSLAMLMMAFITILATLKKSNNLKNVIFNGVIFSVCYIFLGQVLQKRFDKKKYRKLAYYNQLKQIMENYEVVNSQGNNKI